MNEIYIVIWQKYDESLCKAEAWLKEYGPSHTRGMHKLNNRCNVPKKKKKTTKKDMNKRATVQLIWLQQNI